MGSITSRPSVPAPQPQVIYVPSTPGPAPAVTVSQQESALEQGINQTQDNSADTQTPSTVEESQREAREQNLLSRQRGRLSTVLTGFRGVLSDTVGGSSSSSSRKSLLGE